MDKNYTFDCELKIDLKTLRDQKDLLVKQIWGDKNSILWGIVHMIDHIQDTAEKSLGTPTVFPQHKRSK